VRFPTVIQSPERIDFMYSAGGQVCFEISWRLVSPFILGASRADPPVTQKPDPRASRCDAVVLGRQSIFHTVRVSSGPVTGLMVNAIF
jgi:hypothetical protein